MSTESVWNTYVHARKRAEHPFLHLPLLKRAGLLDNRLAGEAEHNVAFGDGHLETREQDGAYIDEDGFINWEGARWVDRGGQRKLY